MIHCVFLSFRPGQGREAGGSMSVYDPGRMAAGISTRMVSGSVLASWISIGSWSGAGTVRVFPARVDWVILSVLCIGPYPLRGAGLHSTLGAAEGRVSRFAAPCIS